MKPLLCILCALAGLCSLRAQEPTVIAAYKLVAPEAEIVEDASAMNGKYVTKKKSWAGLITVPVPAGESFTVWIHVRGYPVCLKTSNEAEGTTKELDWVFRVEDTWTWRKFGEYSRDQLGNRVLVIREKLIDAESEAKAGVDAIAFCPPGTKPPGVDGTASVHKPRSEMGAGDAAIQAPTTDNPAERSVQATISINWDKVIGASTRNQFALNIFKGIDPVYSSQVLYQENMSYMAPGAVRYHRGGLMSKADESWFDNTNKCWNRERIKNALDAYTPPAGVKRVMNIPGFPPYMEQKEHPGMLAKEYYQKYAELCADLVRIINIEQKRAFEYFEVTNEKDFRYWRDQLKSNEPIQVDELAVIYNLCALEMKKVDPKIKVGGPASCRGEAEVLPIHSRFIKATLPNLDFFSFHCYATGDASESDASVYDKTQSIGEMVRTHREMLNLLSPARPIELHLNEFNISWTWETKDPRMVNFKGAVFDALCFVEFVKNGLDMGNAWNECDGIYGKMDPVNYALHPSAIVFHYFNTNLTGNVVETTSDFPRSVVPMAVRQGNGFGYVLINRSRFENNVRVTMTGSKVNALKATTVCVSDRRAVATEVKNFLPSEVVALPPHSVTFYLASNRK